MKSNRLNLSIMVWMTLVASNGRAQLMKGHEIDAERRVTFRVQAPAASEVKVINLSDEQAMGAAEYLLTKGENGEWSVTTQPCRPGFHYYELSIDGFRCADPASPLYFGWGRWSSGLKNLHETLIQHGIQHVWHEGPGSHEWQVWREHLYCFAQLLFP